MDQETRELMSAFDPSYESDVADNQEQEVESPAAEIAEPVSEDPVVEDQAEGSEEEVSEVEALKRQLADMAKVVSQLQLQKAPEEGAPKAAEIKPVEFFKSEDEFNETFASVESANAFANNVMKQAVAVAREQLLQELPGVVKPIINDRARKQAMVAQFFDSNRDLRDMTDFIQATAVKLSTEKPDITYEQLFMPAGEGKPSMLEAAVRQALKRPRDLNGKEATSTPAFAGKTGGRLPAKAQDDFMAEVMKDLIGD